MNPSFLIGATWGFPNASVDHIETHAAHVFLVVDRAYKIKKPVKLPYLDFSTVEKRRAVLARELEINRAYAPDIYLTVAEKLGEPVLVMERFDTRAILSAKVARGIDDALANDLAQMAAEAHAISKPATAAGHAIMRGLEAQLNQAFAASPDLFPAAEAKTFKDRYAAMLRRAAPLLDRRSTAGHVRRCHGDMHCGNIAVIGNKPTLFDAIEFSEKIATIDVLYDLGFLLMDLLRHRQPRAANIVLNRYLHLRRSEEDLTGLEALPLFLATRAGVRALVTADLVHELPVSQSFRQRGEARDYFRAALSFLDPSEARLACVGGLSGTGKSTISASLAPGIGAPPGAIHIRSDIERKVMAGIAETERLPSESYTPEASEKVYQQVIRRAEAALAAGHSVILDAVFAMPRERSAVEALAKKHGARFNGLWLEAPPRILRTRLDARRLDASDADAAVLERQLGYDLGEIGWRRTDVSGTPEDAIKAAREGIDA
ncbi:MAG: AAA family ATPase [Aestuariivirga sp.]